MFFGQAKPIWLVPDAKPSEQQTYVYLYRN